MVNQQQLEGNWNEVVGKLKQKWGKLTDDDLREFNGNVDQLVGKIQRKTGDSREAIEGYLEQLSEEGAQFFDSLRSGVQHAASQAADTAQQGYDALREGYAEAERVVQERPGQALAFAFGVGLVTGAVLTLVLRGRSHERESTVARGRHTADRLARQVTDAVADMLPESLAKFARR